MATAPPPIYQFLNINYNEDFFNNNPTGYVTYAYVNANFLKSVGVALSTAISTTFTGNVTVGGLLTLSGGLNLTGGLTVDTLQVNSTSSFIGQSTFTLIPILPAGYQFITTLAQSISGIKTFSSTLNTNGITDLVSITSPIITATTVCNSPYFNATNASFTTALYNTSITGTLTATVSTSSGYFTATSSAGTSTFYGTYVNGQLSANSLNTNLITDSSSTLPIAITFPLGAIPLSTTTTGDARSGFLIGWNGLTGSNGETDFTNLNQTGNQGGFLFNNIPVGNSLNKLASLLPLNSGGLRLYPYCGQLQVDDQLAGAYSLNLFHGGTSSVISSRGINTSLFIQCGNASGVLANVFQASTGAITPLINLNPTSTTTFNAFHPTTSLGNNISTNTTQYATVGYVNANGGASLLASANIWTNTNAYNTSIPTTSLTPSVSTQFSTVGYVTSAITSASLLPLNNTFTGLNTFTQIIQMTIKTDPSTTAIGTGAGGNLSTLATGSSNTFYGSSAGIVSTLCNNETVIGANSGVMTAGNQSYNTVIGAGSRYLGTGNTVIGSLAGNFSTTVTYNNSTCIGTGSLITASNQITIGRATETVLIPGTANINGTLTTTGTTNINNTFMTGTAVVNNDLQVNGNIIQTLGTVFTLGVTTVFTSIPPYILYIPTTSMGFTLPVPSAAFAGQTFTIRRLNTGGNQIVGFTCPGSPAVWWGLSFGAAATAFNVNTIWQATFLCLSGGYYQIS